MLLGAGKFVYDTMIGDNINTIKDPNASILSKTLSVVDLGSNFIPGAGQLKAVGSFAVKATVKVLKEPAKNAVKAATSWVKGLVNKSPSPPKGTGNPVIDKMEKRIPNSELNAPIKKGNAPTSKKDGKPIEIHHKGQKKDGPFEEMTRTDHRGPGNHSRNHPNKNSAISKQDRREFRKQVNEYWRSEYENGRF
jgi:hypothetical protein